METRLREYFQQKQVDDHTQQTIVKMCAYKIFEAGDTILKMGEKTDYVCLILQGIIRGYYIDEEGNEITKCFSVENDWCCSYNFLSGDVSPFYIEALEKCVLAQFSVKELKQLLEDHPSLRSIYDGIMREVFLESEKRVRDFAGLEAKDRYLRFVEEHPEIVKRVRQEYIASYLGITPSSLSRIKRNL